MANASLSLVLLVSIDSIGYHKTAATIQRGYNLSAPDDKESHRQAVEAMEILNAFYKMDYPEGTAHFALR